MGVITCALILFNSQTFQVWITSKVTNYLSNQFKTTIHIDNITYFPLTGFALDNVYWGDQKNDTLFFVDELKFNFGSFNTDDLKLTLNDVIVEGGYCKMVTYPDNTFNIDVLFNIFDPNDTIPDTISPPFQLNFNRISCHNMRFRLIDSTENFETSGFDGFNQDFYNIELLAKNFWIVDDSLHFELKKMSCKEKSGFEIQNLTAISTIYNKGMLFDNIDIKTSNSHITNQFNMHYNDWDEVVDFNHNVKLEAYINNSQIDMRDIVYFAPFLAGNTQIFTVNGIGTGTVDHLRLKNMIIGFGKQSIFEGSGSINGLPNIDETFIDIKVKQAQTNKIDLERLTTIDLPDELNRLGNMKFEGRYTGFYNDFVAFGKFNTGIGSAQTDINLKLGDSLTLPSYSGSLTLKDFDIGTLLNQPMVGSTSLTANIDGKGFSLEDIDATLGTRITYFEANNYRYQKIKLGGEFKHKLFVGKLDMLDENAEVHFDGTINLASNIPIYKFKASVDYADLYKLHLDSSNLVLSTNIDINFAIADIDENEGQIELKNTLFIKNGIDYPIEKIKLLSTINGSQKSLVITADMLSAKINGDYNFEKLPATLQSILHQLLPNFVSLPVKKINPTENFSFQFSISDSKTLSDLFFPNILIEDAQLNGSVNARKNTQSLNCRIKNISLYDYRFNVIEIEQKITQEKTATLTASINELIVNDTTSYPKINFNTAISNSVAQSTFTMGDTSAELSAILGFVSTFSEGFVTTAFETSSFSYKNKQFTIPQKSSIVYNHESSIFTIDELSIFNNSESITLAGFYKNSNAYNLNTKLTNVKLNNINLFYTKLNFNINGLANGTIAMKGDEKNNYLNTYININQLILDNDTIGDLALISNYDEQQKRLLSHIKSISGKLKALEIGGYLDMRSKPYSINYSVNFGESDLKSFQAFLKDDVSIYYGNISAKCTITGTVDDINVNGNINLMQVLARVEYLKTTYGFNSRINFNKNTIQIVPFQLNDVNGKQGKVEGLITHNSFSNFKLDLKLSELNGFQLLNTTSKDNTLYYGKAYATGNLSLSGYENDLLLEGNIKSSKGTVFAIPLNDNQDEDGDALVNFINKDSTLKSVNIKQKSTLLGFGMNLLVNITPDAEIQLVFDEIQDDKITGTGRGTLKMELTKQGNFDIYGVIAIEKGEYDFTAIDVFTRKFNLKKGGTITWTGDPLKAQMDIQGIYKVRSASVADILTVSESQRNEARQQRVPVECVLNLKGKLLEPNIGFDLNFPDNNALIGSSASALENSLRRLRNEPELMQEQVVSLLILGKFTPIGGLNQASGSQSVNAGVTNTLSDLISSQASNLLSAFIPGLDLTADYQAATNSSEKARAMVTASKKFLNERLEVQTSFDVLSPNFSGQLLGQYNLRPDGNLKLRGFNRTGYNYYSSRNVTSQGVGLYYRKEFDEFNELFKKKNSQLAIPNN
jgi:hypothetical protein